MQKLRVLHNICLVDSGTTHTILKSQKFFSTLELNKQNVSTIAGSAQTIKGSGRAHILLQKWYSSIHSTCVIFKQFPKKFAKF